MSKLINISIDVTKIPREKIIPHKNGGKYVSIDVFVKDEPDQWGKDVAVSIGQSKEERESKTSKVFCGNGKTIYGFDAAPPRQDAHNAAKSNAYQPQTNEENEIPF